jgi:putative membrane protein
MRSSVALLAAALAACSGAGGQDDGAAAADTGPGAYGSEAAAAAPASTPAVTDPQIAAIVVAANQVDIQTGELARERASDPRVKEFAERMITDHTGVNQAAADLVGRLGVTPEPNATSEQLTQGGADSRTALQAETGAAFDRAYVAREVEYHQTVLDALDQTLIPAAQNAELRQLLEQTRPAIEAHLQHAKRLQGELGQS